MLTMIPVHRGTATSPRALCRVTPVRLMSHGSPASREPFQRPGRRLVWDRRFYNAALGPGKKKTVKMPPTALRAHYCHGDRRFHDSLAFVWVQVPKVLVARTARPLATTCSILPSSSSPPLVSSHLCKGRLCKLAVIPSKTETHKITEEGEET